MKKILKFFIFTLVALYLVSCAKPLEYYEDETTKKETTTAKKETTTKKETTETTIIEKEEETTLEETEIESFIKVKSFETDKKTGYKVVKFGKYDTSIGTTEPMEWLILDKNTDSYLLINRYVIDCRPYNDEEADITFKDSTLNEWLNNTFINRAFSEEEQEYLNKVNGFYLSGGGKISIPDISLCRNYFGEEDNNLTNLKLSATATSFAKSNYVDYVDQDNTSFKDSASFYLSDKSTKEPYFVAYVSRYGGIYDEGQSMAHAHGEGIRPVILLSKDAFSEEEEIVNKTTEANEEDNETVVEETTIDKSKNIYKNTTSIKYKSSTAPTVADGSAIDINTEGRWEYGRTPLEWIYVAANYQIICNNRPNSSTNFSYKKNASSGELGCYIPIFTNSSAHGDDYEGRFYSISDYTKNPVDEMSFNNKFENLLYGDYKVIDLLKEKYEIGKISPGIWAANGEYINVVYVSELEEIIQNMKK